MAARQRALGLLVAGAWALAACDRLPLRHSTHSASGGTDATTPPDAPKPPDEGNVAGLCASGVTAATPLPPPDGADAASADKPSFIGLTLTSDTAGKAPHTLRLAVAGVTPNDTNHLVTELPFTTRFNAPLALLPRGRYALTLTGLDASGAATYTGTECLELNADTSYVMTVLASGATLRIVSTQDLGFTTDHAPFTGVCDADALELVCPRPSVPLGSIHDTPGPLRYCAIKADGASPGGNATRPSDCLSLSRAIAGRCAGGNVTLAALEATSCRDPTFAPLLSPEDVATTSVAIVSISSNAVPGKCHDTTYRIVGDADGDVELRYCAHGDPAAPATLTVKLDAAQRAALTPLLTALAGATAPSDECDQTKQDALEQEGNVPDHTVLVLGTAPSTQTYGNGDLSALCRTYDVPGVTALTSFLTQLVPGN